MLNKTLRDLLNEQINKEFYSAYLYLDISNHYSFENLNGFSNWFHVQAQEERDHAMLFMKYLQNNGDKIDLFHIEKPKFSTESLGTPLNETLKHEIFVTASINNIYEKAMELKDFRTMQFLDWFIKEQGEEEMNADNNIKKFEMYGKDPKSLYMLDAEMSTRVYAPASLVI